MTELPILPLNTVLFPGIPLHLHIFEPRYLLMVKRCLEKDLPFGVVLIRQGKEALGPLAETYSVGCTARIIEIEPLPNDEMNITALGDERFKINKNDDRLPYRMADVENLPFLNPQSPEIQQRFPQFTSIFQEYLLLLAKAGNNELDLSEIHFPDENLLMMYLVSSIIQIPNVEKQSILAIDSGPQLFSHVFRLVKRELSVLSYMMTNYQTDASDNSILN
jgi:uncharacterized protein